MKLSLISRTIPKLRERSIKINLFIAGVGAVGGTLFRQIRELDQDGNISIVGVCNTSKTLWLNGEKKSLTRQDLARGEKKDWTDILKKLNPDDNSDTIFVDATGDQEVAELYLKLFKKGVHVVTPSKLANTRKQVYFDLLQQTAEENNVQFLYETNVGAGLPVLRTVRDLVKSGDVVTEISGVLSGTMTYLFSQLDQGTPFSEAVLRARQRGYAEPDPRDDLSGEDVARKMMILSRVCGYHIERDDLYVEAITPKELRDVDAVTFFEKLSDYDTDWQQHLAKLDEQNKTLRYTGLLNSDGIRVGLQEVEKNSPLGRLSGTNNLIQIKTKRYADQPLIIQGPGAGKEVTAAGVLADVLNIIKNKLTN